MIHKLAVKVVVINLSVKDQKFLVYMLQNIEKYFGVKIIFY